ncbi:hypothetical protein C8N35_108130 [Breoghania corrubedonensis]|uniref:Uncharacterized protein n=1 Tax=Breoghania corrubedonensis TaxID=665038 RepID=A0A2T5V5S5_9HYPH|nr:hypothetical protein [Breoghania corrubedonensis]PTW59093.1 hypothetical protein C8N35_108130 [Breoghania corrubedonensis]
MGIFSSRQNPPSGEGGARPTPYGARDEEEALDNADMEDSNVQEISPLALRMQEKLRSLDNLKSRVGGLGRTFEQMNALAAESSNSISLLSEFVDSARTHIETEIRLKSENAKLATDLIDRNHEVKSLTAQLDEAQAEVHSLRKRATETRTALEGARNDLVSIRDNNKKVNEEYRSQSARLVEANAQIAELTGELKDTSAKLAAQEEHSENLKNALEGVTKREKELQQNLAESAALLEQEVKKSQQLTSELEAAKREVMQFRNESIDLKSRLDISEQEIEYAKSRLEEEKRKHDNEIYTLNSEIENLSSQRRIGAHSLQEMATENNSLKERNRDMVKRMQEIEHLLDGAQKNHEHDRNELVGANAKLRELNLRYNAILTDLNHERSQNLKYADNNEELVEENKKLQRYRIKYDSAVDQIAQLKSVIANYQMAMEKDGISFEHATGGDAVERVEKVLAADEDMEADIFSPAEETGGGTPGDTTGKDDGNIVKLRDRD